MNRIGIISKIDPKILKIAKNIRKWALKENNGYTYGMCRECSIRIITALKQCKIEARLSYNYSGFKTDRDFCLHYWVIIKKNNEEYILDVTADQFNYALKRKMGNIVFGPKNKFKKYHEYTYTKG